ncbi:MAG: AAA family ATPase [Desulfomicrobium sp.]|nr:AAA family ATPase [Pseudomonadota bacterium]MBV1710448.1 AAA family ATPase [Desulfomicrobium sp.]MBU4570069.1 AAA family ATPase [Pseudomonadota bacterium]MBU4593987.1 AAA family ATPase [Pseudomonadota bacterium]MBV1721120.1 AAA family ATPase [Desulfomicrobium sp.]
MYENFYGLRERPFTIVPNPGYLYMSEKHKLAFAHLKYGLGEGTGFVVLTGGIGTGKTTLIRYLLGRIEKAVDVALVFNTNVTGDELLRLIIREFEAGEPGSDKAANLAMLNEYLIERFSQGRHAIIIVDEAQNLSRDALEEVRLLSNLQGNSRPLLQVVLVGQPELRRKLADPTLTQLAQRITSTFHLSSLELDEAKAYICFRLAQAGGNPLLFTPEAMEAIHTFSAGVPRLINILCDAALVHGFADELPVIGPEVVQDVARQMSPMLHSNGTKTSADTEPSAGMEVTPDLDERLSALERRLTVMEERFAAWGTDAQLLTMELAALKERAKAAPVAAIKPAPAQTEALIPPETPIEEQPAPAEKKPEKSGGFLKWLWG